jgi:hypothetical protein
MLSFNLERKMLLEVLNLADDPLALIGCTLVV